MYDSDISADDKLQKNGISISMDALRSVASKYHMLEIDVFGSSIRSDMTLESDIDLLVSFDPGPRFRFPTCSIWRDAVRVSSNSRVARVHRRERTEESSS